MVRRELLVGTSVVPFLLILTAVAAVGQEPPALYWRFDGVTAGVTPDGERDGTGTGGLEFGPGVVGRALRIGSPDGRADRSTHYPVSDVLEARSGSLSFWIQPLDWHGGDAPFHIILRAMDGDTYFLVYKYFNSDKLLFLIGQFEKWTSVRTPIGDWGPGQWHQVAGTWSADEIALWLDGRQVAVERLRYPVPPFRNLEPLSVGPGRWLEQTGGSSLVDELRLYRRVLDRAEIEGLYRRVADAAGVRQETGLVTIATCAPTLDGTVGADEYAFTDTGFLNLAGPLARRQGHYHLGYDDRRLYLAVVSPLSGAPPPVTARDADLSRAERLELYLAPAATRSPLHRLVLTTGGGIADSRDGQAGWDCPGLEVRQGVSAETWTAELAVPFAALGLEHAPEGGEWRFNLGRVHPAPEQVTCLAPVVGGLDDWSRFLTLRFRRDAPRLRVNSLIDLDRLTSRADLSAGPTTGTVKGWIVSSTGRDYGDRTMPFTLCANGRATPYVAQPQPLPGALSLTATVVHDLGGEPVPLYRRSLSYDPEEPLSVLYAYTLQDSRQLFVAAKGRGEGDVRVRFLKPDGGLALEQRSPVPAGARFFNTRFDLDPRRLTPGDYLLKIDHLAADGAVSGGFAQEFRVPAPGDPRYAPYLDPDADKVPAPWTPLRSDDATATVWGRRHDFGQGFLVSGLESQGRPLLAAPARLRLDGRDLQPVRPPSLSKLSATDLKAIWEKSAELGPLSVTSRMTVHFDGYCEVSMTLAPAGQVADIRTLSLDFPFRGDQIRLVRDAFVWYGGKSGAVGESWHQTLADLPMLWLGNETVGFNWVAEDLAQWHYRQEQKNAEILRQGGQAVLRLNLVDTPLKLDGPRTIEFGFVLTPSRPLDPRLRRYRTDKEWQMWGQGWRYFNYLDADHLDLARLERESAGHDETFVYLSHNFVSPFCPEWAWWEEEWRHTRRPYGELTGDPHQPARLRNATCYAEGCLQSDTYRNFHLRQMAEFFRRAPVLPKARHAYFDFSYGVGCDNAHHGCARWVDRNGKSHARILNRLTREVTLATYRMIKRADPEAWISYHLGYQRDLPVQHFSEILAIGEGWEPRIATQASYYDILTPELFRATYLPQTWGLKVVFINQLVRSLVINRPDRYAAYDVEEPETRRALLHLIGYLMVHDVDGWWAYWSKYRPVLETLWATQDKLGWDEAVTFHPYWSDDSGVRRSTPDSSRVMASAYARGGKLLLAVLNDTDQEQAVALDLDLPKLGVAAGLSGRDVWQPERTWVLADTWQDRIPPRGFRLSLWQ